MSEAAKAYYQERADRLGITMLTPVLTGTPVPLLGPGERLSIHAPHAALLEAAGIMYERTLNSVEPFNLAAARTIWPGIPPGLPPLHEGLNHRHARRVIPALMTNKSTAKTGHLRDLQVEAVTPDEVRKSLLTPTEQQTNTLENHPDAKIYLITSGEIYAGRTFGRVSCLTIAMVCPLSGDSSPGRKGPPVGMFLGPRYIRSTNTRNRALIDLGISTSRAIGNLITPQGARGNTTQPRDISGIRTQRLDHLKRSGDDVIG